MSSRLDSVTPPSPLAPSAPPASSPLEKLTPAERLVAIHLREGLSNKEIASLLDRSVATIKNHVSSILRKLGAQSRSRVIARLLAPHEFP